MIAEIPGKAKTVLPFAAAALYLGFKVPAYPAILLPEGHKEFTALKAVALLIGLLVGFYFTQKRSWRHSKSAAIALGNLAVSLFGTILVYDHLLEDAENYLFTVKAMFFTINILIGVLLFCVIPALVWSRHRMKVEKVEPR